MSKQAQVIDDLTPCPEVAQPVQYYVGQSIPLLAQRDEEKHNEEVRLRPDLGQPGQKLVDIAPPDKSVALE